MVDGVVLSAIHLSHDGTPVRPGLEEVPSGRQEAGIFVVDKSRLALSRG
jgi:hypothetical protein